MLQEIYEEAGDIMYHTILHCGMMMMNVCYDYDAKIFHIRMRLRFSYYYQVHYMLIVRVWDT